MLLAESIACSDKLKSFFLLFFTSVYSQKISLSRSRITLSPPLCAPRSNLTNFVIDALERCAPSKQIIPHSPERLGFDGSRAIDSSVLPVPPFLPPSSSGSDVLCHDVCSQTFVGKTWFSRVRVETPFRNFGRIITLLELYFFRRRIRIKKRKFCDVNYLKFN